MLRRLKKHSFKVQSEFKTRVEDIEQAQKALQEQRITSVVQQCRLELVSAESSANAQYNNIAVRLSMAEDNAASTHSTLVAQMHEEESQLRVRARVGELRVQQEFVSKLTNAEHATAECQTQELSLTSELSRMADELSHLNKEMELKEQATSDQCSAQQKEVDSWAKGVLEATSKREKELTEECRYYL